jgi:plastocyanin
MNRILTVAAVLGASALTTAALAPAGGAASSTKKVMIKDFNYSPKKVTISRGTKVTWTDKDSANHTVTFRGKGARSTGNIDEGQSRSLTFKKAGTFKYICEYHPNMHGTVVVR